MGANIFYDFLGMITMAVIIRLALILVITLVFKKVIAKVLISVLKKMLSPLKNEEINSSLDALNKTFSKVILVVGLYFALASLPFSLGTELIFRKALYSCIYILIASAVFIFMNTYERIRRDTWMTMDNESAKTILPLVLKIIKFCVIVIVVVAVANEFGFREFDSLIKGLGIGGLAVAFAAQDMLKNVFGGFVVITDKSFNVGDFIQIGSTDGIVEEVGIRSTKVRTLEQELVVVPNGKFADDAVVNYSKRGSRRIKQYLGATYDTSSDSLKIVIEKIKATLLDDNDVINSSINVKFDGFGASSLDIIVLYLVNTGDYGEYLKIKERMNFEIMKIFEEENVDFAFPSMSLYMEKTEK